MSKLTKKTLIYGVLYNSSINENVGRVIWPLRDECEVNVGLMQKTYKLNFVWH